MVCRKRCREDKTPDDLSAPGPLYRSDYANFVSELFFWWVNWLLFLGYKRTLEIDDLGRLPKRMDAEQLQQQFKKEFLREQVDFYRLTHAITKEHHFLQQPSCGNRYI